MVAHESQWGELPKDGGWFQLELFTDQKSASIFTCTICGNISKDPVYHAQQDEVVMHILTHSTYPYDRLPCIAGSALINGFPTMIHVPHALGK